MIVKIRQNVLMLYHKVVRLIRTKDNIKDYEGGGANMNFIRRKKRNKLMKNAHFFHKKELRGKYNRLNETADYGQGHAKIGFWTYEVQTGQVFWTEEMYDFLGCGLNDLDENLESFLPYVHSDDLEMVKEATEDVLKEKEYDIEYRIVPHNGQIMYVNETTKKIFDENNNLIKIVGTLQDITQNKVLEQELRESYKIISQAEVLAHIGRWGWDMITNMIYWSDEACRIYGLLPEISCSTYEEFRKHVHPDDVKIIDDLLKNSTKEPIILEFRYIRDDGTVRNIYELVEITFNKDGKQIYMNGTIQDITEETDLKNRIEFKKKKIDKIQRRFDALIKESVDVFEILDHDGRIVYISETSEKITGYKPEERIGKKIFEYYEESEIQKLSEMIEFALNEPEKRITRDISFKTKAGNVLYLEFYMQNFWTT